MFDLFLATLDGDLNHLISQLSLGLLENYELGFCRIKNTHHDIICFSMKYQKKKKSKPGLKSDLWLHCTTLSG